jgi:hypothetical protein
MMCISEDAPSIPARPTSANTSAGKYVGKQPGVGNQTGRSDYSISDQPIRQTTTPVN